MLEGLSGWKGRGSPGRDPAPDVRRMVGKEGWVSAALAVDTALEALPILRARGWTAASRAADGTEIADAGLASRVADIGAHRMLFCRVCLMRTSRECALDSTGRPSEFSSARAHRSLPSRRGPCRPPSLHSAIHSPATRDVQGLDTGVSHSFGQSMALAAHNGTPFASGCRRPVQGPQRHSGHVQPEHVTSRGAQRGQTVRQVHRPNDAKDGPTRSLMTLGLKGSTVPLPPRCPTPNQSAVRISVPRLSGSDSPSTANPNGTRPGCAAQSSGREARRPACPTATGSPVPS